MRRILTLSILKIILLNPILVFAHITPFGFWKITPLLDYDFTNTTTLSSIITFTRGSTATYFDSAGVMQTAAINTPRFDYDMATLAANGLLMEPAATNLLKGSNDLNLTSATYWNAGGSSMTSTNNTIVAPDGTTTAERFSGPSGICYAIPTTNPATTNGSTYTFSLYVKSTSSGNARLGLQEDGGSYTIYAQTVMSVTTSWKRFSVTGTRASANPMRTVITLDRGSGDLATLDVWGAQLELGSYASSYIPTTTATVTRSADSASFNSMGWFKQAGGTLFAEWVNLDTSSTVGYNVFGVSNTNVSGTFGQNAIYIADADVSNSTAIVSTNSWVCSPGGNVNGVGAINRMAMSYGTNLCYVSNNRAAFSTDSSVVLPSAPAYAFIGSQPDGSIRPRYIRKIKYFSPSLPGKTLEGL